MFCRRPLSAKVSGFVLQGEQVMGTTAATPPVGTGPINRVTIGRLLMPIDAAKEFAPRLLEWRSCRLERKNLLQQNPDR
jgi:hypothetical protein